MNSKKFFDWCRVAVCKIRYKPDRDAVHKELYEHMEDRYTSYLENGYNSADAEAMTVNTMGDPAEVAHYLGKTHKSIWVVILTLSRIALVVTLLMGLTHLINGCGRWMDDLLLQYQYSLSGAKWAESNIVYTIEPNVATATEAYVFKAEKAMLQDLGEGRDAHLYVQLSARVLSDEWECSQESINSLDFMECFWAIDNQGNYYYSERESYRYNEPAILGSFNYQQRSSNEFVYNLQIYSVPKEDFEWIELHYDRAGQNVILRIELPGGASK